MTLRRAVVIAAFIWLVFMAGLGYAIFQGFERDQKIKHQVDANCVVVSVLLQNRADRKQTTKLFEPIRRQNPKQFDALVKKAEAGDRRLERVQGDLACNVP